MPDGKRAETKKCPYGNHRIFTRPNGSIVPDAKAVPRRMQANRTTNVHGLTEHDESWQCHYLGCQPVQQQAPVPVRCAEEDPEGKRVDIAHDGSGGVKQQERGDAKSTTQQTATVMPAKSLEGSDAAPPTPAERGMEQEQAHKSLNDYCAEVHKANEKWWFHLETGKPLDRNFGELIALVHSELSEALEGHRKNLMDDKLPHRKMVEVELADTVIRIFDICAGLGFDLDGAYREKMAYNAVRDDHKKEARLKANGKKY